MIFTFRCEIEKVFHFNIALYFLLSSYSPFSFSYNNITLKSIWKLILDAVNICMVSPGGTEKKVNEKDMKANIFYANICLIHSLFYLEVDNWELIDCLFHLNNFNGKLSSQEL